MRKMTVEEVPHLCVQSLKGFVAGDRYYITGLDRKFAIDFFVDHCRISCEDESTAQTVRFEQTKVGYGERLWFCCPVCEKRCSRLYSVKGLLGCRNCSGLTYTSCQFSGNHFRILTREVRKVQRKLGMDLDAPRTSPDYVGINDWPVFKPRYMRWEKFEGLMFKLLTLQHERTLVLDSKYKM